MTRIAIVGLGCHYPDAASPTTLWENVLAGRRAFRQLPDERMRLADYWSPDPAAPDHFYARTAAVIRDYEFDRVAYKVPGSTYRSTDLTHWLALDVAARALADAGFPDADGLPRERTAVVIGNTLTGEFSRAHVMRLRWPYVRRVVAAALAAEGWADERLAALLSRLEQAYKSPFPPIDEDSLAGGLSNTIAGRICNQFDLGGGGYTVDAACASSLLSVVTACRNLAAGDIDVALAGGVDLSIDPFEIVGFAKAGALAQREMRVYDRDSNGFWPGEGCGMAVLMREPDALAAGRRVYATVAGWGVSSDGRGGITRPEPAGYLLALRRAYRAAGFGIETVPLFEGHGTGTAVGDATELKALSHARRTVDPAAPPAAIGSIKAMIGHTKAAAGVAGLIKAALAVHHEVLPPTTGCVDPHPELTGDRPALRALRKAEPWPEGTPVRAGVTAMGFGGINTHLVLDAGRVRRRAALDSRTRAVASSAQDAELLLLDAPTEADLVERVDRVARIVSRLSRAELADAAAALQRELRDQKFRAAIVARSPDAAQRGFAAVREALSGGRAQLFDPARGVFAGAASRPARIGYLFPGQGSGKGTTGGALRRRFAEADRVFERAGLPATGDAVATAVAQPRIVTGSAAGLRVLARLGLGATVAVGHSLGELTALHWAGALSEEALLRIATERGATMTAHSEPGAMAGIGADADAVLRLTSDEPVVIAGYNGPRQTVISGPHDAVERACRAAAAAGLDWARLAVSHAFHSPLMAAAADTFAERLAGERFEPMARRVVSTVTGEFLEPRCDLRDLLHRQITSPVQFAPAVALAAGAVDLFIEVGPGHVLTQMVRDLSRVPAVAIDTDGESIYGLLCAVGAGYTAGASVDHAALFADRLTRPLALDAEPIFFANPCEAAPTVEVTSAADAAGPGTTVAGATDRDPAVPDRTGDRRGDGTLAVLRRLAAERAELPAAAVADDSRLLDDLHLSSITIGQLVNQAARELRLPATLAPTAFATATLRELAEALDDLAETAGGPATAPAMGVAPWVRAFAVEPTLAPVPAAAGGEGNGAWRCFAPAGHPLAERLRNALAEAGVGGGVLLCLPTECTEADLELALEAARAAAAQPAGGRFVLVQRGRGAAGFARTARLEAGLRVTVVDTPQDSDAIDRVVAEVAATTRYTEASYAGDGARRVPLLRALPRPADGPPPPVGGDDVLLVTGGGKGITAECALGLAAGTGARLAIIGRSDPARDAELAENLRRMTAAGATVRYLRADVTDASAVRAAVAEIRAEFGRITGVLHGAGVNEPAALVSLDGAAVRRAFSAKVGGLRAVLDAVDRDALRLMVTFGSVIGRAGLPGEAHYAAANDWLAELTRQFARGHPLCRTVCLEWSVWAGVGMGERLSAVDGLLRAGVTPISTDQGVDMLRRLLAEPDVPPVVVVAGRMGDVDTLRYEEPDLPMMRFVERPLVRYHGIELVTEADLTPGTDPYLDDHQLDGNLLFPAVFGLEAMAQAAAAVRGRDGVPVFERVEFMRPIVVPPDGATTIRIAALVTGEDTVETVIRSAESAFAADHFRATLHFAAAEPPSGVRAEPARSEPARIEPVPDWLPPVPLDPARDMYGDFLFQGKRFQRLLRYRRVAARHAEAVVATSAANGWFSAFLPGRLLLGDPGARDSFMHGIQVCVPDATLLPAGVERIEPGADVLSTATEVTLVAAERERHGDTYVYDVAVRDSGGRLVESWTGLRLRAVGTRDGRGSWPPALVGPFLQRQIADLLGVDVSVALEPEDPPRRRFETSPVLSRLLGRHVRVWHRPDGRPESPGLTVSSAHGASALLVVAGTGSLGCDLEPVTARHDTAWRDLLGEHAPLAELIRAETGEAFDDAATRVWCAIECLQKAGQPAGAPLALVSHAGSGWTILGCGGLRIATYRLALRTGPGPVVAAILVEAKG